MRIIERAAALFTVLAMPVVAWALARSAAAMWTGLMSTPIADAEFALEDGLALCAATLGAAIAAYLALTGYAMILGAVARRGRAVPRALAALAPSGWTRVTATALGLSLSAGFAGPALAAQSGASPSVSAGWVDAPVSASSTSTSASASAYDADEGGTLDSPRVGITSAFTVGWAPPIETPTPDPPRHATPSPAITTATSASPAPTGYVVKAGDSLWRIAESLLDVDATDGAIAAAWPKLYKANQVAIGENPSLIHPGLHLTIPTGFAS